MIDIKMIRKPKNEGNTPQIGTGERAYGGMAVKEAAHAVKADVAEHAKEADRASSADRATQADNAKKLENKSLLQIQDFFTKIFSKLFLSRKKADTAEGKITFEKGLNAVGESTFENLNVLFKALVNQLEANVVKTGNLTNEEKITTFDLLCRNLAEIYKLNVTDTATIVACILKSSLSSTTFRSGLLGEGMRLSKEGDRWILELDEIVIRKTMTVFELIVQRIKHQGGWVLHSPCGGKITKVENVSGGWKCYHDATEDFEAGDLILCQNFKVGSVAQNPDGAQSIDGTSVKRYWRKADAAGKGYVILSKSICEPGSSIPDAGDEFAVMGNLTNTARQNAILVASSGQNTPFVAYYKGINGFSLSGKEVMREGNLSGVFDADFGNLSGFGLYANNVFLKGVFRLTSGKTVEEYADNAAKTSISNLKLGVRNLAAGYKKPKTQDGGYYSINTVEPLKGGMDYVVSFDAEILIDKGYLSAFPHNGQRSIPRRNTVKTQGNKRYAIIIKPQTDVRLVVIAPQNGYAVAGSNKAGKAIFSNVAIYEGTKDVGFIEAPEDVEAITDAKLIQIRTDFEVREGQISTKLQEAAIKVSEATTAATRAEIAKKKAEQAKSVAETAKDSAQGILVSVEGKETNINAVAGGVQEKYNQIAAKYNLTVQQAEKAQREATKAYNNAIAAGESKEKALKAYNDTLNAKSATEAVRQDVVTRHTDIIKKAGEVSIKASEAKDSATRAEMSEAAINLKADGIVIQAAKKAVEGVNVGNVNMIRGAKYFDENLRIAIDKPIEGGFLVENIPGIYGESIKALKAAHTSGGGLRFVDINLYAGETYTFSCYITRRHFSSVFIRASVGNSGLTVKTETNKWTKLQFTFTPADAVNFIKITHNYNGPGAFWVCFPMLTKGSVQGDFQEAPEDVMASVEAKIKVRSDAIENRVNAVDGRVTSVVQTIQGLTNTVSGLDGRISTVEQTQSSWSSTIVKSDKIASQILQSDGNVRITAQHIKLEGIVTVDGNLKIHEDGSIEAKNGIFRGTIEADSGRIGNFEIGKNGRLSNYIDNEYKSASIYFTTGTRRVGGTSVFKIAALGTDAYGQGTDTPVAAFEVAGKNSSTAVSVLASSDNKMQDTAIDILMGHIAGFAIRPVIATTDITLSSRDGIVICANASNTIVVRLPSYATHGKIIIVRRRLNGRVIIRSQGTHRIDWGAGLKTQAGIEGGAGRAHLYYFVEGVWFLQHLGI